MEHFDVTQWTDFVRGVVSPARKEAMAYHLSQGCEPCAHLVALLERIQQEAWAEPTVPEPLVQAAKAVFPVRVPTTGNLPEWLSLPPMVGHLVYTNMASSAREGARALPDATVQVMYHAGDYTIDLQVEREPESTQLAVVGQIVNREASSAPLRNLPVVLMARKKLVAQSHSNRFGEFCLFSRMQSGLKLCLPVSAAGRQVEIPLSKVMAGLQ